jgi:hypothetical protein
MSILSKSNESNAVVAASFYSAASDAVTSHLSPLKSDEQEHLFFWMLSPSF